MTFRQIQRGRDQWGSIARWTMVWWQISTPLRLNHEPRSTNFNWFGWDGIAMPHSKNEAAKEQQFCLQNQTRVWTIHHSDGQPWLVLHDRSPAAEPTTSLLAALAELSGTWWTRFCGNAASTLIKWSQPLMQMSKKLQLKKEKAEVVKEAASSDSNSLIVVTACTTGSPTLTWQKKSHQKREEMRYSPCWNQRHLVSATVWQLKKSPKLKGSSLQLIKQLETASLFRCKNWSLNQSQPVIRQTEELIQTTDGKADVFTAENAAGSKALAKKNWAWWSLLQTLDEWGFQMLLHSTLVVVSDRPCLLYRTSLVRLKINYCSVLVLIMY